ncbi:DUF3048 domain-containing protein [Lysinibacillus sp. MHQ-1]|nr:DUF3048 domain-containing protein [Lysinibacillus sp. MHQ-1]
MFKTKKLWMTMAFSALVIGGCSKDTPKVKEDDERVTQEEKVVEEQIQKPAFVAPLTGEAVQEEITQRPIVVTINNHPAARPQSGLAAADIIYEMLAEGNVTRFFSSLSK